MKAYPAAPLMLAALLFSSVSVSAQTKVGLLNVERILRDSPTAQRAQTKLREEFASREQELSKRATQLQTMKGKLENNALTMADSERQTREREFDEATRVFQRQQRTLDEDMSKRRQEELAGVSERINRAVKVIAEAEKFDIIFREVAWGNPRIDITDRVIKALGENGARTPGSR